MKKLGVNLYGILAIALAFVFTLSLSAFTAKETKRDSYTFYYDGPVPATPQDIEEESNWKYDTEGQECSDEEELACTITIDEEYVDDTNPSNPTLLSTAALQAEAHDTLPSAFVTGSADGNMAIANTAYTGTY